MTFRELYGKMTAAQREEISEIREEVDVERVERDSAEAALFGGSDSLVEEVEGQGDFDEFEGVEIADRGERLAQLDRARYDREDVREGFILNAAILLEDPERLEETRQAIASLSERKGLGLEVVDWAEASGIVGQFALVIRLVLFVMIGIIFLVAMVILNNTMVMATMERTSEIGTMRAIGAQRPFVLAMFLLETLVLGVLAGLVGIALAVVVLEVMGSVGLPATTESLEFLFGGDRLYPTWSVEHLLWALAIIVVVSVISTVYPARLAARIQPVVAMRGKE
jgi:ABC-type lipoprotein release transport system permease subunit